MVILTFQKINSVNIHLNVMDLPETNDRHYKILNILYLDLDGQQETVSSSIDVGIATQTYLNHLHNLIKLVEAWNGPISVGSIYIFHLTTFCIAYLYHTRNFCGQR